LLLVAIGAWIGSLSACCSCIRETAWSSLVVGTLWSALSVVAAIVSLESK
jgi:hypothetical protein